eukprot:scaffold137587_cov31-Tisochrysis_lutea.AAC.1
MESSWATLGIAAIWAFLASATASTSIWAYVRLLRSSPAFARRIEDTFLFDSVHLKSLPLAPSPGGAVYSRLQR